MEIMCVKGMFILKVASTEKNLKFKVITITYIIK